MPGAAQREVGFHHMLARFMGWDLPTVKRYDGKDCPLYVETIFPLFFVEQKIGWTTIPAAIPTQFQIRDVHRRSVEYLMGFDTHELELKRQDLDLKINALRQEWSKTVDSIEAVAGAAGLRVLNLPKTPTSMDDEVAARSRRSWWAALGRIWISICVRSGSNWLRSSTKPFPR